MRRRHFLKALAAVSATVSLAPRLAIAATLEEATRPYVIQPPVPLPAQTTRTLGEYGAYVKVSDLMASDLLVVPASFPSGDPLVQYGIQGWKMAYLSKIVEPQHRLAVLENLARQR